MSDIQKSRTLNDAVSVMTAEARLSYPHLIEPKASFQGQDPKYQASLIFPKNADLTALRLAAKAAAEQKWGTRMPQTLRLPFRDGADRAKADESGRMIVPEAYQDSIYLNVSSKDPVELVDRRLAPVMPDRARELFYAGCYVRAYLRAFAYDVNGNRGVSFALNGLQWLRDGDNLGNRLSAGQAFEALDDDPATADAYASAPPAPAPAPGGAGMADPFGVTPPAAAAPAPAPAPTGGGNAASLFGV